MNYASMARMDFNAAMVKYIPFVEEHLKPLKISTVADTKKVDKKIDKFISELGFNIYCEEYIVDMVQYVVSNEDMYTNVDCMQLLTLIITNYASEHSEYISDDFKSICKMAVDMLSIMLLNELFWGNDGKNK